jgi:hypothetical protein
LLLVNLYTMLYMFSITLFFLRSKDVKNKTLILSATAVMTVFGAGAALADSCPNPITITAGTQSGGPAGSANFTTWPWGQNPTPVASVYGTLTPSLEGASITFYTGDWSQQPDQVASMFAKNAGSVPLTETKLESGKVQCVYIAEVKPNPGIQLEFKGPDGSTFKEGSGTWDGSGDKRTCNESKSSPCTWTK